MTNFTPRKLKNMENNKEKKTWQDPELKKFNKTDFIKAGAVPMNLEGPTCYKSGS